MKVTDVGATADPVDVLARSDGRDVGAPRATPFGGVDFGSGDRNPATGYEERDATVEVLDRLPPRKRRRTVAR
jgi:hypothetical protein